MSLYIGLSILLFWQKFENAKLFEQSCITEVELKFVSCLCGTWEFPYLILIGNLFDNLAIVMSFFIGLRFKCLARAFLKLNDCRLKPISLLWLSFYSWVYFLCFFNVLLLFRV